MEYACLIYAADEDTPGAAAYGEFMKVSEEARRVNALTDARGFQDAASAKTVKIRDGKLKVADGPFEKTKKYLNGFFIFECATFDEAIEWAAKLPASKFGCVEVRPVRPVR